MHTTIKRKIRPSVMTTIFENFASIVNVKYFKAQTSLNGDEKVYYEITIRHNEEQNPKEQLNKAIALIKKEASPTEMIFRVDNSKDFKGTIFAIFPHDVVDYHGHVTTYQHVGQHCSGDYHHMMNTSKPAKEEEYKDLYNELKGSGYNIKVTCRRNKDKYNKSYREMRKMYSQD